MSLTWTEDSQTPAVELDRLHVGMELVFLFPQNGWPPDREQAARHLEVGRVYRLERFEIHGWHTDLWLAEVPGVRFNSVQFAEVER